MFIHSNENVNCAKYLTKYSSWCLWALNVLGDLFSNSWPIQFNRPTFLKQETFQTSLLLFVE